MIISPICFNLAAEENTIAHQRNILLYKGKNQYRNMHFSRKNWILFRHPFPFRCMNSMSRVYFTLSTSLQILNWNLAYFMAIQVFMFLYLSCLVGICFISLVYILSALSNFFSRRSRSICCILHKNRKVNLLHPTQEQKGQSAASYTRTNRSICCILHANRQVNQVH